MTEVRFATTLLARMRGLKAHKGFSGVLILAPCCDVHTFGMRACLDIAFVARNGMVLSSFRRVPPSSRRRCAGAALTLERYASNDAWMRAGDVLQIDSNNSHLSIRPKEG